jgi:Ca2+-binding EF-hand superfamily protein
MKSIFVAMLLAAGLSYPVAAQTTSPPTTTTPAAPSTTAASSDSRFKAADSNGNGVLEGSELSSFRQNMTQIDKDHDGKVSKAEFADAMKAGLVK